MKRPILLSLALSAVLATLLACGPSAAQVKTATAARYRVQADVVLPIVVGVVEQAYKIQHVDPDRRTILTVERWYEADGMQPDPARRRNRRPSGAIKLSFKIVLVPAAGALQVEVTPVTVQHRGDFSALIPLTLADPDMPTWIRGKTDALNVAIWDQLRDYAVTPG